MKIKYLIVMLLLFIPISLGNTYFDGGESCYNSKNGPYEAIFTGLFIPSETIIPLDEPVNFYFYMDLAGDPILKETGGLDISYFLFENHYYFGVPTIFSGSECVIPGIVTSLGVLDQSDITQTDITELPYYIKSCHVKCDTDSVLYDHSFYPSNYDYSSNMEIDYPCEYDSDDLSDKIDNNETIYSSIYCEIETNDDYLLKGGAIDMNEFFEGSRPWSENRISEYGYTCVENPRLLNTNPQRFQDNNAGCSAYILEIFELTFVKNEEVEFYFDNVSFSFELDGYTWTDLSDMDDEDKENIDSDIEGAGGSGTPDKTQQGNDQKQKEKQKQYEQQIRIVEKKNDFLNNLVDICVVLFSIMLLTYYLIAIAVLGYLLATLFPKIISSPYTIIKSFRENRGDNK